MYLDNMNCIDEPLSIYGTQTTTKGKLLLFEFIKCDPKVRLTCKTDSEVEEWLKNKYLVLAYNK